MPPLLHADRLPGWIAVGATTVLLGLLLVATGQPILSDDIWLHLSLGRAYAAEGPWLSADPLLAAAPGPPLPSAWLTDVIFYLGQWLTGFQGLRILHVGLVAALLLLAGSALKRASGSLLVASLATSAFAVLAAYRVVQIRPHLFTMLAVLILYRLLFEHRRPPSRSQIAGAIALCLVWANLHAGFVLGPLFIGAGLGGTLLAAFFGRGEARQEASQRATRLGVAFVLAGLATAINPSGFDPHIAYWVAGSDTPDLGRVADEWTRVHLFEMPVAGLPPSLLSWGINGSLWILTPIACLATWVRARRPGRDGWQEPLVDPALIVMAAAALCAPLFGVRFLWLGILPLLLLAQISRTIPAISEPSPRRAPSWGLAMASVALAFAFLRIGPWPMISSILPQSLAGYGAPYPAAKYSSQAVWLLRDAELEGTLFGKYSAGGFFGYWLAPEIRTFVNGSLNVDPAAMAANRPILEARGERPGESLSDLLDRHGIDLFLGARLPTAESSGRPLYYTTAHLERTPGWIPIFRNLSGAIYLRNNPRNQENLQRIARYYRRQAVPFNSERGFEVDRVIASRPDWAIRQGVVPTFFTNLMALARPGGSEEERQAARFAASLYAILGLYERSIGIDQQLLEAEPDNLVTLRRLVWSLLRTGQYPEAAALAGALAESPDPVSRTVARAAEAAAQDDLAEGQTRLLPLLTEAEGWQLSQGIVLPAARH